MSQITVVPTGDTIVTRRYVEYPDGPFQDLMKIIRGADVAFTNLEIPLSGFEGAPADLFAISADPAIAHDLREMGFDIVSYANNHALNYGERGLFTTLQALRDAGLPFAGAGNNLHEARRPAYAEVPAGRVGLVAATSTFYSGENATHRERDSLGRPGVNPIRHEATYVVDKPAIKELDRVGKMTKLGGRRKGLFRRKIMEDAFPAEAVQEFAGLRFTAGPDAGRVASSPDIEDADEILKWVREARALSDVALVSLHCHEAGVESPDKITPPEFLVTFARACVDAGADMVIGHGPHRQLGMEMYKGKPIFWSLGDFIWQVEYMTSKLGDKYMTSEMRDWTPHEYHSRFVREQEIRDDRDQWDLVLPECTYEDHTLKRIGLVPATLGWRQPLPLRGTPRLATGAEAAWVLEKFAERSRTFGTKIEIAGDTATVVI